MVSRLIGGTEPPVLFGNLANRCRSVVGALSVSVLERSTAAEYFPARFAALFLQRLLQVPDSLVGFTSGLICHVRDRFLDLSDHIVDGLFLLIRELSVRRQFLHFGERALIIGLLDRGDGLVRAALERGVSGREALFQRSSVHGGGLLARD